MSGLTSKELIIKNAAKNKPGESRLPDISFFEKKSPGSITKFREILKNIGGFVYHVHDYNELVSIIRKTHGKDLRIYSPVEAIQKLVNQAESATAVNGHDFENVEVAIINGHFGVAENGAVWVTENQMGNRVVPFICQHLAVVVNENQIVPTMHEAYHHPALTGYGYGTFIAGPSKTADIEQSLVLGAHGPKSMTVFVLLAQTRH